MLIISVDSCREVLHDNNNYTTTKTTISSFCLTGLFSRDHCRLGLVAKVFQRWTFAHCWCAIFTSLLTNQTTMSKYWMDRNPSWSAQIFHMLCQRLWAREITRAMDRSASLHNRKRLVVIYLRSSEHHPQKGSLAARHSSQLVNRPQSDIGNFVT